MSERLLSDADASPEEAAEATDLVAEETPRENMTPTEWASGIRRLRRSVIVHDTGHLIADLDDLGARIDATPDGPECDALIDEYEALAERIKVGVRYVAEQRSQDWIEATRDAIIKERGHGDKKFDDLSDDEKMAVYYERMARQIVEPKGVTGETLAALYEAVPSEVAVILGLIERTNTTVTGAVESRDFSSRRSGKKRTRASSGR